MLSANYMQAWLIQAFSFLTEKSSAASKLKSFLMGTLQYFGLRSKQLRLETKVAHTWLVWRHDRAKSLWFISSYIDMSLLK